MQKRNNGGFTILEILVVIVIMALLLGITFRLTGSINASKNNADAIKKVQTMAAILEEYRSEYGIYPPVELQPEDGGSCGYNLPGSETQYNMPLMRFADQFDKFKFGLISFLINRVSPDQADGDNFLDGIPGLDAIYKDYSAGQVYEIFGEEGVGGGARDKHDWIANKGRRLSEQVRPGGKDFSEDDEDEEFSDDLQPKANLDMYLGPTTRDRMFFKRIIGWMRSMGIVAGSTKGPPAETAFKLQDSWGNPYIYICEPPYTTYAFFSMGPDGKCVAEDPLNREAKCPKCSGFHNRDNVYGALDDK